MTGIELWSTTAANNNSASPNGFPENMAASGLNDSARQVMAAIRAWYEDAQWINLGHTPTRTGNTTFTIPTDVTAIYSVGRRIKATGGSTGYSTITASSFAASDTTVTVVNDSGNLPSPLTTVSVGILSLANTSSPAIAAAAGTLTGTTLAANVVNSSLTSVGTLASLTTSGAIELGNASDTTLSRVSAGVAAIEGSNILTAATGITVSSGSFVPTWTGFSVAPTGTAFWSKMVITGGATLYTIQMGSSGTGTSNSTSMLITNVPAAIATGTDANARIPCILVDNGIRVQGAMGITSSTNWTFFMGSPPSSTGFTASGTKGLGFSMTFLYT